MKTYLHSLLKEEEDPIDKKYLEYIQNGFPERKGDSTSELLHRAVSTGGVVRRRMVRTVHGRGLLSDHRRGRVYSLWRWDLCG